MVPHSPTVLTLTETTAAHGRASQWSVAINLNGAIANLAAVVDILGLEHYIGI